MKLPAILGRMVCRLRGAHGVDVDPACETCGTPKAEALLDEHNWQRWRL